MRRYLIAGLLIWLPLGVTVMVIKLLVDMMDQTLLVLPAAYHPDVVLGFYISGLGVLLSVTVVLITGVVVANFFGRRLVALWEKALARIHLPVVEQHRCRMHPLSAQRGAAVVLFGGRFQGVGQLRSIDRRQLRAGV